jgi:hypothetical protein
VHLPKPTDGATVGAGAAARAWTTTSAAAGCAPPGRRKTSGWGSCISPERRAVVVRDPRRRRRRAAQHQPTLPVNLMSTPPIRATRLSRNRCHITVGAAAFPVDSWTQCAPSPSPRRQRPGTGRETVDRPPPARPVALDSAAVPVLGRPRGGQTLVLRPDAPGGKSAPTSTAACAAPLAAALIVFATRSPARSLRALDISGRGSRSRRSDRPFPACCSRGSASRSQRLPGSLLGARLCEPPPTAACTPASSSSP